jgi:hypothetical protein
MKFMRPLKRNVCGWGSPELRIFAKAGRDDGIDAMQAILTRLPQLKNAKSKGVKIDGLTRDSRQYKAFLNGNGLPLLHLSSLE